MSLIRGIVPRQAAADSSNMITDFPAPITRQGASLIITAVVMILLTSAWTVMRIVSRKIRKLPFATEDYLYFVGFALFSATALSFILGESHCPLRFNNGGDLR